MSGSVTMFILHWFINKLYITNVTKHKIWQMHLYILVEFILPQGFRYWASHRLFQPSPASTCPQAQTIHSGWSSSCKNKCIYIRPIYIGKNQNPKNLGFFVVPFTLPEKPITFRVFGTKSACPKKPESHTCVLVSGAHARLLSTFDRTRVVRITSRAAVGWFRWRSRATWPKTRIIPARLERAFTLAKNQWNFDGVSKNHAAEVFFL